MAVLYVFLIFTPVLLLFSWLLEIGVDTPSKNLAHEIDTIARYENPRKKADTDEDDRSCGDFFASQWFIWLFLGLFVVVLLSTEIYGAVDGNGDRIRAMHNVSADATSG